MELYNNNDFKFTFITHLQSGGDKRHGQFDREADGRAEL
jgi:hypothetical protein